jgi:hypothetical protein
MGTWIGRLLVMGGALFAIGWLLVLVSGHGGNSTGGSEIVWRIGGVMVYLAVPLVLIGALLAAVDRLRALVRWRP